MGDAAEDRWWCESRDPTTHSPLGAARVDAAARAAVSRWPSARSPRPGILTRPIHRDVKPFADSLAAMILHEDTEEDGAHGGCLASDFLRGLRTSLCPRKCCVSHP